MDDSAPVNCAGRATPISQSEQEYLQAQSYSNYAPTSAAGASQGVAGIAADVASIENSGAGLASATIGYQGINASAVAALQSEAQNDLPTLELLYQEEQALEKSSYLSATGRQQLHALEWATIAGLQEAQTLRQKYLVPAGPILQAAGPRLTAAAAGAGILGFAALGGAGGGPPNPKVEAAVQELDNAGEAAVNEALPGSYPGAARALESGGGDQIFHGTDLASAEDIVANGINQEAAAELGGGDVFWATENVAHAQIFAESAPGTSEENPAAVVQIDLGSTLEELSSAGIIEPGELPGSWTVTDWERFNGVADFSLMEGQR